MTILTIGLFLLASATIVAAWNRLFEPVPWRLALALWLVCAAYQGTTLFTPRVDVPGNLAFVAYPWKATGRQAVNANTGIVFTQIAPWSRVARDILRSGEAPLWNRMSASGAPLLANQQTAIFHPFTLLGLLLPLGKAFTLSACLRLFLVAFFTFVLLRNWEIGIGGAIFGAVAYTFCSFHIVWLLFPLGLSTMMLPLCLVGVQELVREARARSYTVLLIGLSLSALGGHPESALWVWIVTMLFAVFTCATAKHSPLATVRQLALIASAFIMSMLLTAFFWFPTLRALRETPRYQAFQSREANPADHGLSAEWLLPLITPNVLGTPANGTYTPPRGSHPAVLNDYGEVASSYAGLATLALALAAPFAARRRPLLIALGLMVFSLLTFAEAPVWRDLVRVIPFAGISIHQRLRIFWNLGVCIAAALTVDAAMLGERRRQIGTALILVLAAFAAIYALRHPAFLHDPLGVTQLVVPLVTTILVLCALRFEWLIGIAATLLVFADLAVATYGYNPSSQPEDVYPVTGAIATLQHAERPFRFAAWGWSFLPDTPGYYGIEDIKTTDPVQHAHYMRLMKGYLNADPASYDQVLRDASQPFFDFLNIKYIYVPPDQSLSDPRFVAIYRGTDGTILQNTRVLPRYFLVPHFSVEPSFDQAVGRSKQIRDFGIDALVDHVPARILKAAPTLTQPNRRLAGGFVHVIRYGANDTSLDVTSNGWNLLVSSDVNWPGWRAYWNGQRQPPVIVNGAFLGCFIPPGKGQLVFRYVTDEYTQGARATGVGVTLLAVCGFAQALKRRRSRRPI
ncbi:MAG TPA: hypothetical protein VHX14_05565 [Thermoanaerobaculia bacterium]|jgi:hypothetical protein|nr:hypothetical protein [Thermoanaerobaculia bacterium]